MSKKVELLNLSITQYGSQKEGKLALLLEGFKTQKQLDFVMEQFNKFMKDNALEVIQ